MRTVGLAAVCAAVARLLVRPTTAGCGAGTRWEPDRAPLVRGLFELEEVRLPGSDPLAEFAVLIDGAYGFVGEPGGGMNQHVRHGGAGEGPVDEEGALVGALAAAVLLFVVENQLAAHGADRLCEVLGGLVGVGAVGRQQSRRETERGEPGQGVDGIRADALARGIQDETEGALRMAADTFTGLDATCGVSSAAGDQKACGVPEDSFLGAPAVVPARGELDGGQAPPFTGRTVPGGKRRGVGADIAPPALEQARSVSEADDDQDQTVTDLLQQLPAPFVLGVRVLPGVGHDLGLFGRQPASPVAAPRVQGGGQPIERPDRRGGRTARVPPPIPTGSRTQQKHPRHRHQPRLRSRPNRGANCWRVGDRSCPQRPHPPALRPHHFAPRQLPSAP